jgi:phosphosulfolactate phosphohydrolase-like enzyme
MAARSDDEWELNDGALAALALSAAHDDLEALFARTAAGKQILDAGLDADLAFCAQVDRHDVVPVLHDRQISLVPAATAAES